MKASLDDPEVVEAIRSRLIDGQSIRQIGASHDMPCATSIYLRMADDEDFRTIIASAREAQQESEADYTVELADAATPEDWQVKKLQIWARQWRAAKLAPKKYGDRVGHDVNTNINLAFAINAAPVSRIAADVERTAGQRADGLLSHDGANGFVLSAPLPPETGGSGK